MGATGMGLGRGHEGVLVPRPYPQAARAFDEVFHVADRTNGA